MSEAAGSAVLLAAAVACCALGLGWIALAMDVHWQQVRGAQPLSASARRALRLLGVAALVGSLALCFVADHATMAPLVWLMSLAAGALAIALLLSWRPRSLAPLVAWVRPTATEPAR